MTARYSRRRKQREAARRPWFLDIESRGIGYLSLMDETVMLIASANGKTFEAIGRDLGTAAAAALAYDYARLEHRALRHYDSRAPGWYSGPLGVPYMTRLPNQSDEEGGFPPRRVDFSPTGRLAFNPTHTGTLESWMRQCLALKK